jgi:hypothetical protein
MKIKALDFASRMPIRWAPRCSRRAFPAAAKILLLRERRKTKVIQIADNVIFKKHSAIFPTCQRTAAIPRSSGASPPDLTGTKPGFTLFYSQLISVTLKQILSSSRFWFIWGFT